MIKSTHTKKNSVAATVELEVEVQYAFEDSDSADSDSEEPPSPFKIIQWAQTAFSAVAKPASHSVEVAIRVVGDSEMRELNHQYRGKNKTTNVLSFPFDTDFETAPEMTISLLGDIVICHSVVVAQAKQQDKTIQAHYAHMVTHGILHLCGYDHETTQEAEQMEAIEVTILEQSNILNPYILSSDLS